jgi:6-phosphogluconolactonase/glucosamine-6-phosphate isomerase/deaminase
MSDEPELRVLADADAVSEAAATAISDALREAADARDVAHWATTGGSAPIGIYRLLAAPPLRDQVSWDRVHLWWGDDRYVPRDHPLSNVLPADQILLASSARAGMSGTGETSADVSQGRVDGAAIPLDQLHPFPTAEAIGESRGPAWAATRYEGELRAAGLEARDGWPVFDVVLLGVGPDGHILSVFPGSTAFDASEWALPVPAPTHVEPHVTRVTLNPGVLDVARHVIVVVHGEGKAAMVAEVLGPEREPRRLPAQLVRRPGVLWLLDEAAAGMVRSRG